MMERAHPSYKQMASQSRRTGQLVTIAAGDSGLDQMQLAISMARAAAQNGHMALLIDCGDHDAAAHLNLTLKAGLCKVLTGEATMRDAKHIDPNSNLVFASAGDAPLDDLLGPLAAMSLSYDWVFVILPSGCTPAHVRLMGAAEQTVLMFDSSGDRFMRAYWMLDAIRARSPRCDPAMVGHGPLKDVTETYALFSQTVREFLGAPPPLAGIQKPGACLDVLGQHLFRSLLPANTDRLYA